jgi:hypothetical protein
MEIDKYPPLWKDGKYIPIKELWENYTRRLFFQRLFSFSVLEEAIRVGVRNGDFFGYAEGIDDATGRFQGLCLGDKGYPAITSAGFLINLETAKAQIEREDEKQKDIQTKQTTNTDYLFPYDDDSSPTPVNDSPAQEKLNTHCYVGVTIDPQKLGTTAGQIKNEIPQHFMDLPGASITVSMDINVTIPEGIPDDVEKVVKENCKALKIEEPDFGEKKS